MVSITDNAGLPSVRISWPLPTENGSPISAYELKIQTSDPLVYATTSDCDGGTPTVVAARFCDV